jgi:hypothetical protein
MADPETSTADSKPKIVQWVLSGALVALIAWLATRYDTLMTIPMTIIGAFIILMVLRRSWTDLLLVLAGAAVLELIDVQFLASPYWLNGGCVLLGMSSFAVLGVHAIWAPKKDRLALLCAFVLGALSIGSQYMGIVLLDATVKMHPKVFDLYLFSFDSSLRVQTSFALGRLLSAHPWLGSTCQFFYTWLQLPVSLIFAAKLREGMLRQNLHPAIAVGIAFLVTGPIGVVFYNLLPACGPLFLFGSEFPFHPPVITEVMHHKVEALLIPEYWRNAIPSLHLAWVLLVWWCSRKLELWIRAIAFAFLAFTALATLGLGQHYFVDLVVAYPFAVMVLALCSYTIPFDNQARRGAFLWGIFATLVWFGMLSFTTSLFWITPIFPWFLVIATVLITVVVQRRLQIALETEIAPVE